MSRRILHEHIRDGVTITAVNDTTTRTVTGTCSEHGVIARALYPWWWRLWFRSFDAAQQSALRSVHRHEAQCRPAADRPAAGQVPESSPQCTGLRDLADCLDRDIPESAVITVSVKFEKVQELRYQALLLGFKNTSVDEEHGIEFMEECFDGDVTCRLYAPAEWRCEP